MTNLKVVPVKTRKQMKQFTGLLKTIYADDELWVPPLWLPEQHAYKRKTNPVLGRSEHVLFLAYRDSVPAGRIIAYIDPRYNEYHKSKTGMIGSFECIDDAGVSAGLFDAAEKWLGEQGSDRILGPINPVAECWGLLIEGNTPPVYMSPHNPLYYNELIASAGYRKARDLVVYEADVRKGYRIPERFENFADRILEKRKNLNVRNIDRRNLYRDASYIKSILNEAVAGNWGFVPVMDDEMTGIVKDLKPILDERAICFVEDSGRPVAVALGFPDINKLIKKIHGRLTPQGIAMLLTGRKKIRDYRLWGLAVLPEYHGQGLDVLLYVSLARQLAPTGCRMEANYMLEDNPDILNAIKKMGMSYIKKYRVYEKEL